MTDEHIVINTDERFTINPDSRIITQTSGKSKLMQYDHNSECYEFEMPRYVDNHDMSLCNKVQVNYINISSDRSGQSKGPYLVTDLKVDPNDDEKIVFSWLISRNATGYSGTLNFNITFKCLTNSIVDYAWSTDVFTGIKISTGIDNDNEEYVEDYTDILEQWKQEVLDGFVRTINGIAPDANGNVEISVSADTEDIEEIRDAIESIGGTVEITSGSPEKSKTVLIVDPDADSIDLYTAEEIDSITTQLSEEKVSKWQGADNAGMLLYVADDGVVVPLAIGSGLEIKDGMLTVTNAQTVAAICGQAVCGETICGGVN